MIKVLQTHITKGAHTPTEKLHKSAASVVAKGYVEKLSEKLKDHKCTHHPDTTSFVYVHVNPSDLKVNVSADFCCPEFEKMFQFD